MTSAIPEPCGFATYLAELRSAGLSPAQTAQYAADALHELSEFYASALEHFPERVDLFAEHLQQFCDAAASMSLEHLRESCEHVLQHLKSDHLHSAVEHFQHQALSELHRLTEMLTVVPAHIPTP